MGKLSVDGSGSRFCALPPKNQHGTQILNSELTRKPYKTSSNRTVGLIGLLWGFHIGFGER